MRKAIPAKLFFPFLFTVFTSVAFAGNEEGSSSPIPAEKTISTFEIQSIHVSNDGLVSWTASEEHGSLPYVVEQYIFDKWVRVGEVEGVGTPSANSYSVAVTLSSGDNKFRVRQKGFNNINRMSEAVSIYSKKNPITYSLKNKCKTLDFSDNTFFIVYDPFGSILKQGYGNSLDISNYTPGYYCLIYDNKLGGFEKKSSRLFKHKRN